MQVKSNPFMEQTDPNNPFGPNYKYLDRKKKENYKYSSLSKHIKLSQQDQTNKLYYGSMFIGSIPASGLCSYMVCSLLSSLLKSYQYRKPFMCSLIMSITIAYCYSYTGDLYHNNIIIPYTKKYLSLAIQNGFIDYKIS